MKESDTPRDHLERITNQLEILDEMDISIGEYEELAKKDEDYNKSQKGDADLKKAMEKWKNRFVAICYLNTLDKKRYGALLENLENDYTMGKDKYPKDITSAYNYALHYRKYEPWKVEKKKLPDGLNFVQQQNDDKPEKKSLRI